MKDLLFDTPWWLLGLLLIGGGALFWSGNNRQDKTLKCVGLAIFALGIAMGLVSYFVDTDVEAATKKTRQLIYSVEKRDWPTLDSVLDDRTSLAFYRNKQQIMAGAKATVDSIGLKSVHIIGTTVDQHDTLISVNVRVLSEQDITSGQPVTTDWKFDWQDFGTGWRLTTITPLKSEQVNPDQIEARLSRGAP
jgi:hypothetical protein